MFFYIPDDVIKHLDAINRNPNGLKASDIVWFNIRDSYIEYKTHNGPRVREYRDNAVSVQWNLHCTWKRIYFYRRMTKYAIAITVVNIVIAIIMWM